MGYNFLAVERDQVFLMPPSLTEWLEEDHLAWFVRVRSRNESDDPSAWTEPRQAPVLGQWNKQPMSRL